MSLFQLAMFPICAVCWWAKVALFAVLGIKDETRDFSGAWSQLARQWVDRYFGPHGTDVDELDDDEIWDAINRHYPRGSEQFIADHTEGA